MLGIVLILLYMLPLGGRVKVGPCPWPDRVKGRWGRRGAGRGRYRDYNDEYLHEELGLVCIVGQGSVRYSSR